MKSRLAIRTDPITGIAGCCAPAAIGQVADTLPRNVMFPAIHSITSAARASSVGGIVMPSAFAVLRLMTARTPSAPAPAVGRLLALEDAIDIGRGAPALVNPITSIGDQAAVGDEIGVEGRPRAVVLGRKRDDQIAMNDSQRARRHDQTTIWSARECSDDALDLGSVTHIDGAYIPSPSDGATDWITANWPIP